MVDMEMQKTRGKGQWTSGKTGHHRRSVACYAAAFATSRVPCLRIAFAVSCSKSRERTSLGHNAEGARRGGCPWLQDCIASLLDGIGPCMALAALLWSA